MLIQRPDPEQELEPGLDQLWGGFCEQEVAWPVG